MGKPAGIEIIGIRDGAGRLSSNGSPNQNNSRWISKWKALQQYSANHAKDGCVRTDAERQRYDRDGCESGILAQHAEREMEILPKRFEKAEAVHMIDLLANPGQVAELAAGGVGCIVRRHPARGILGGFGFEVGLQLAGALFVPLLTAEKPFKPTKKMQFHGLLRSGAQHAIDCADELVPPAGLRGKLFAPFRCKAVVARFAIVLGSAPERRDPTAILEPMKRRIERTVLDLKDFVRTALDGVRDGVAVGWAEDKRLQDQQIEGSLKYFPFQGRCAAFSHIAFPPSFPLEHLPKGFWAPMAI